MNKYRYFNIIDFKHRLADLMLQKHFERKGTCYMYDMTHFALIYC